jgi:hypothetical protein
MFLVYGFIFFALSLRPIRVKKVEGEVNNMGSVELTNKDQAVDGSATK